MLLSLPQVLDLAAACAPAAAPQTLAAIAKVESGFDSLAIGVNGPRPLAIRPASARQASAIADRFIESGFSVDLGLTQINSKNLTALGVTAADLFDPCRNLAASAEVLSGDLGRALAAPRPGLAPELQALSYYNTGNAERGLANGYVAKVSAAARALAPARGSDRPSPTRAWTLTEPPAWAVFPRQGPTAAFVISPAPAGDAP